MPAPSGASSPRSRAARAASSASSLETTSAARRPKGGQWPGARCAFSSARKAARSVATSACITGCSAL